MKFRHQHPFAAIPHWVIAALDNEALAFYVRLARYANEHARSSPSVRTLAAECACSASTVRRRLRDLEDTGILEARPRYRKNGGRSVNEYVLLSAPPLSHVTGAPLSPAWKGPPVTSLTGACNSELEGLELETSPEGDVGAAETAAVPWSKIELDAVFVALAEVWGRDPLRVTRSEAGRIAAASKELRDVWDGLRGDLPDVVRTAAAAYRAGWPNAELTPTALAANWGRFADGAADPEDVARRRWERRDAVFAAFEQEHGEITGARLGPDGAVERDPLGTDPRPDGWYPYPEITRGEVWDALVVRGLA